MSFVPDKAAIEVGKETRKAPSLGISWDSPKLPFF